MKRFRHSAAASVAALALLACAVPARGADVLWQAAATPATPECQVALSVADGPVEIALGGSVVRLLGDARATAVTAAEHDGATALAVTTDGRAGVVLEAPATCRLGVETQTGDITLFVPESGDLGVQLATSGEITVDFSVAIDYHRHEEPAKRGSITIGSGTTAIRLSSRQGAVSVLRSRK